MKTIALLIIAFMLYGIGAELQWLRYDFERAHGLPNIAQKTAK